MIRLACCRREKGISIDFDEHDRVMTYSGLESCIMNSSYSYDNESSTSRANGCATDSLDEDDLSCSSSKDAFGLSFSSQWFVNKREDLCIDEWKSYNSPKRFYEKPSYPMHFSDVETMKEKFAKLLLGEDVSGGCRGVSTALALSNAIANLAATVFGELWKLEPLPEERKSKWKQEMDWLLSPANFMVELVPARQNGANGRMLEIMTPKARSDIHVNLPALQKLDSMLIETLDSMVKTEFWYSEDGSRAEGRSRSSGRQSKKWWLPSPRVPVSGLSTLERDKLIFQAKFVHQVMKASKAINQQILIEIPVPEAIRDALPKSGKASLNEGLYKALCLECSSAEEILQSLNLKNEHSILEIMNQLETAIFAWKQKLSEQANGKSPVRHSWSFARDSESELDRMEMLLERTELLLQLLKTRFPNLPQTFLDVTKIQYNKDIGHSILEAYSRVLGNLAFSILSRIADILQEDDLVKPNSPEPPPLKLECFAKTNMSPIVESQAYHTRHSLIDQMNRVDGHFCISSERKASEDESSDRETRTSTASTTPRSRAWCYGREVCSSVSP